MAKFIPTTPIGPFDLGLDIGIVIHFENVVHQLYLASKLNVMESPTNYKSLDVSFSIRNPISFQVHAFLAHLSRRLVSELLPSVFVRRPSSVVRRASSVFT